MVSIVLVSHSAEIVNGIKTFVMQMVSGVPVYAVGGTADGELGTDYERIKNAIEEAAEYDGTLILFDIGSSFMTAEMVLDDMPDNIKSKTALVDAALVEGALEAAANAAGGASLLEIIEILKPLKLNKI